jgi:sulfite reductase (ferredoxin)
VLRPLLALWKEQRLPEESFGDFCSRVGLENLQEQTIDQGEDKPRPYPVRA